MQGSGFALTYFSLTKFETQLRTQLELTETSFKEFMDSISNIFTTKLQTINTQGQDVVYNNWKIAFAAGLIFRILVKVDVELLEHIKSCLDKSQQYFQNQQALDNTKYLFQTFLTQAVYSLDKSEPLTYLNQILRYKDIHLTELGENRFLSYFYSLIYVCQCADFMTQFSQIVKFSMFDGQKQEPQPDSKFTIYQMDQNSPAVVFLPKDEVQYQKKIIRNQKKFLNHTLSHILIESSLGQQAAQRWFTNAIASQPFKGAETEFFTALLSNFSFNQERYNDLIKNTQFMTYIRKYFVVPNSSYEMVRQQLRQNIAPKLVGQEVNNNATEDIFKTIVVVNNQTNQARKSKIMQG